MAVAVSVSVVVSVWAGVPAVVSVVVSVVVPVEAAVVSVWALGLAAVVVAEAEKVWETPGSPAHRSPHPAFAGVGR